MIEIRHLGNLQKPEALSAIAVAGRGVGALNLLQVCILSGWDIPPYIAGRLLAFSGRSIFA
jgi:hypothetical protein